MCVTFIVSYKYTRTERSFMRKCIVQLTTNPDGSQGWRCGKYLMSNGVTFRMESERCYHYQCPGRKNPLPERKSKPCSKLIPEQEVQPKDSSSQALPENPTSDVKCSWDTCENPIIPPKKKFCSLACKSRSTSRTYRQKQRERRCSIQK